MRRTITGRFVEFAGDAMRRFRDEGKISKTSSTLMLMSFRATSGAPVQVVGAGIDSPSGHHGRNVSEFGATGDQFSSAGTEAVTMAGC